MPQLRASRIPLDHYNYPVGNEHAAAEMPKGKLIVPGPEQLRGRKDLFDVVQHTCHLNPGTTGGDLWLEARGKQRPAGPEERRGRKDLAEVLHQTSNPYEVGEAGRGAVGCGGSSGKAPTCVCAPLRV